MSEPKLSGSDHPESKLADLGLYQEQARQGTMLSVLCGDVKEVKECLLGREGFHEGLVVEVDRLTRSRKKITALGLILFTTLVGTVATIIVQFSVGG